MDGFLENLQRELIAIQEQLKNRTVSATDSNNLVTVTANGHQEIIAITLEPDGLYPRNQVVLEKAITQAVNDALHNSRNILRQEINQVAGGVDFSNFPDLC